MARLMVTARMLPDGAPFSVIGRDAWALLELQFAGSSGCTPLDNAAPRWSAYIHALRSERGLLIETIHEPHAGAFPGKHARYVLKSAVEILYRSDLQVREAA